MDLREAVAQSLGGEGVSQFRNESLQSLLSPLSLRGGWWLLLTHFAEDTEEARREQRGQTVTPRLPFREHCLMASLERSSLHTHVLLYQT